MVLAGALLSAGCAQAPRHEEAPRHEVADEGPRTAAAIGLATPELGVRARYSLQLRSTYGFGTLAPSFGVTVAGDVDVTPVEVSADRIGLLLELPQAKVALEGDAGGSQVQAIESDVRKPCLVTLTDGRITELRAAPGLHALAMGIARSVAGLWQHVGSPGPARWDAIERDGTGVYSAAYESVAPDAVHKRKSKYTSLTGSPQSAGPKVGGIEPPRVLDSLVAVRGNPRMPAAIDSREKIEIDLHGTSPLVSETTIGLQQKSVQPDASAVSRAAAARAATTPVALDAPYGEGSTQGIDLAKINGLSLEQIVSSLERQAARGENVRLAADANGVPVPEDEQANAQAWMGEQGRLFSALTATLRQVPGTVARVTERIRRGSAAHRALVSALGACGKEEAHAALLALIDDSRLPKEVRTGAGVSLLRTPTPSATAVAGVEKKRADTEWHRLGVYGLGTYARLLRERGETAESKRLVQLLIDRLEPAPDAERADLLKGLSNAAAPETFAIARRWLTSRNVGVRRGAVMVLRLLEGENSRELILAVLQKDPDKDVRLTALRALERREPNAEAGRQVALAARNDASERVRYEAVQLLGRWKASLTFVEADLKAVAASDGEEEVRNAALAALSH